MGILYVLQEPISRSPEGPPLQHKPPIGKEVTLISITKNVNGLLGKLDIFGLGGLKIDFFLQKYHFFTAHRSYMVIFDLTTDIIFFFF